jgi:hypothetical protein
MILKKKLSSRVVWLIALVAVASGVFTVSNYVTSEQSRQAELQKQTEAQEKKLVDQKRKDVRLLINTSLTECGTNSFETGISAGPTRLVLDGQGNRDELGVSLPTIKCLVDALEMPESTWSRIEITRALDGQLSDSWSDKDNDWTINANWSYHPDSGVNVILELESGYLE